MRSSGRSFLYVEYGRDDRLYHRQRGGNLFGDRYRRKRMQQRLQADRNGWRADDLYDHV